MASASAMSAARSMPTVYSVPLGPRVRPPRLLPGTKAENTNPQPEGPVPQAKVWVQGKWRDALSNAAKERRLLQSAQVEKALRRSTHGMNIYAYRQIRTNQVVYSLSRVMQNNKILSQLIYHGKQTKPAALRRDVWRPYFSIHFPQTQAGAEVGLDTFQLLRELSARRQLSPPEGFLIATRDDVEKAQGKYDPAMLARLREEKSADLSKLPKLGRLLPPKYRARKLMDQKASSVADVAFALARINDAKLSPQERVSQMESRLNSRHLDRSRRNRRRFNEIRRQQELKNTQIQERQTLVDAAPGQLTLDKYAAERIALEHKGILTSKDRVTSLENALSPRSGSNTAQSGSSLEQLGERPSKFDAEHFTAQFTEQWNEKHSSSDMKPPFPSEELDTLIQQKIRERDEEIQQWEQRAQELDMTFNQADGEVSRQVTVLWSDLKDAMNAQNWSSNVQHDWLDAKAVVKKQRSVVRQPAYTDEDGHEIEEQKQTRLFQTSSSPHIMGRDVSENWFTPHDQLVKQEKAKDGQWDATRREDIIRTLIDSRSRVTILQHQRQGSISRLAPDVHNQNATSKKPKALLDAEHRLRLLQETYPEYSSSLDQVEKFSDLIRRNRELVTQVQDLEPGTKGRQGLMNEEHAIAKAIRDDCDTTFPGFSAFERNRQEKLAANPSKTRAEESQAELDVKTVDLVLAYHRKMLQEQGDSSWDSTSNATSTAADTGSRKVNTKDLKDLNVEIDIHELDKRGMWSRVKGIFGR